MLPFLIFQPNIVDLVKADKAQLNAEEFYAKDHLEG